MLTEKLSVMRGRRGSFLIVGAGGLVGRYVHAALDRDIVIATYHHSPEPGGVTLDITNHESVRSLVRDCRPGVIILAAADAYVERCEREPEATRQVNVDAARVVAKAALEVAALLVVFSSDYVFDGTTGEHTEENERHPINEYGRQKVALEDLALATGRGLVCRTSGVFGPDPRRKNFVCQLVDHLRAGKPFDVPSDQLITPTYAPSLASAVVELANNGETGIVHTAGPRVMNRLDFARKVAQCYGLPPALLRPRATVALALAAPRPLRCGLNVEKLRRTLGHDLLEPGIALTDMRALEST